MVDTVAVWKERQRGAGEVTESEYSTYEAADDAAEFTTATATANGLTTGLIPLGARFVTVTSVNVDHWVTLPDFPVGWVCRLQVGTNGCEIRTHAPATVGINAGVGAAAESAIPANTTVELVRTTAVNYVGANKSAAGVVAVTQAAAP